MNNYVYILHYIPNCEEDYVVFISFKRKDCINFINKHSHEYFHYYHNKNLNRFYNRNDLVIRKYKINHWYK